MTPELLNRLAPCGLDCKRCTRFIEGEARHSALKLKEALTGFEKMAPRVADKVPALAHYQEFLAVLDFLSTVDCVGCRAGGSTLPFCAARTCFREKGVDFCFQCDEYPCQRNQFPANLAERWRAYNDRMKAVGVEAFHEEQLKKPRY